MSNIVDERIVEMQFNNADFEKNVATSMGTLERLDKTLNRTESGKYFTNISNAASNIDLSGLTRTVELLQYRFSTLGIISSTVLSNLTTTAMNFIGSMTSKMMSMVKTGGLSRAMNIEKAKFQLEGLKIAWEDISGDLSYAVNETAYSLDSAAIAASTLAATGVKIGDVAREIKMVDDSGKETTQTIDSMAMSLRSISGVASQTSRDYDSIAQIFSTVAGNGKLMGMQLTQLSSYGLNVAADLADAFGVTEAKMREMVSKGQVSYEDFVKTMFDKYAEHAVKANETITGVMSNIRSAFSKIGAEFYGPIVENNGPLVKLLDTFRLRINDVKSALLKDNASGNDMISVMSGHVVSAINALQKFLEGATIQPFFDKIYGSFFQMDRLLSRSVVNIAHGFGNLSTPVSQFTKAISNAFDKFAPKIDLEPLFNFSTRFKALTADFKVKKKTIYNTRMAFEGLFSVFRFGYDAIFAFAKGLKPFGKLLPEIGGDLMSVAGSAGLFVNNLVSHVRDMGVMNTITETTAAAVNKLADAYHFLKEKFLGFKDSYSGFGNTLSKGFSGIVNFASSGISAFFNGIKGIKMKDMSPIDSLFEAFGKLGKASINVISKVGSAFGKGLSAISGGLADFINHVAEALSSGDFDKVIGLINTGIIGEMLKRLIWLYKDVKKGSLFFGGFGELVNKMASALGQASDTLKAQQIHTFTTSVLTIAAAAWILSTIDNDKLALSTTAILAFMGALKEIMNSTRRIGKNGVFEAGGTDVFVKMAKAILTLSIAMKIVSTIDADAMWRSLGVIAILMAEMTGLSILLGKYGDTIPKGVKQMTSLAKAVLILAISMRVISSIDENALLNSFLVVASLVAELGIFAYILSSSGDKMTKGMSGIVMMAGGVLILANAMKTIASIDEDSLVNAVLVVTILLTELGLAQAALSATGGGFSGGLGMVLAATSLLILANVMQQFTKYNWNEMTTALSMMGLALLGMSVCLGIASITGPAALAGGIGLVLTATSLLIVAGTLQKFASFTWPEILKAVTMLGLVAIELGAIMALGVIGLAGGPGLLVTAAALTVLAIALKLMTTIDLGKMSVSLATIGLGIAALTAASVPMLAAAPGVLAFSGALAALGLSVVVFSAGVAAFSAAVMVFSTALLSLWTTLTVIGSGIADIFKTIADGIGNGISGLTSAFEGNGGDIAKAIITGVSAGLIGGIPMIVGLFKDGIKGMLTSGVKTFTGGVGSFSNAGMSLFKGFLKGFSSSGTNLFSGIRKLMTGAIREFKNSNGSFISVGKFLIQGLIKGITSSLGSLLSAVGNLAKSALNKFKSVFDMHSPSKETEEIGEYFGLGFVGGVRNLFKEVTNTVGNMAELALESLSDVSSRITDIVNGNVDTTISITPVIDTSSLSRQTSGVADILSRTNTSISASINDLNNVNKTYDELLSVEKSILAAILNGHDIYLNENVIIGRINRRLGKA